MKAIQSLLFSIIPASSNVRAVILEWSGKSFQAGDISQQDWEQLQSSLFPISQNGYSESIWSALYTAEVDEQTRNSLFQVSQGTIDDQPYTLTVIYNADSLIERIDWLTKNIYTGYSLAVLDDKDYVLFFESSDTANIAAQLENLGELKQLVTKDDFNGYYYFAAIPASNWIFCGFISSAFFNSGLVPFLILLFIICMVLALLVFVFLIPSVNTTIVPLKKLEETMKKVSESGPDFYSEIQSDDEIGSLSDVFNDMLDDMRINTEEKIEREKREQLLHYSLMLSQINSHFFYNTLNMISSLARQKRYEDVLQANIALTTIFQDCLRSLETGMTDTIIQEYGIVNCYWTIAALDPQNKAKLIWDIPDDLWEESIPKNIIQPIVENALFHGLDDPQTGIKSGWIKISFQKKPGQLILTISNNGLPILPETLNKLNTYRVETKVIKIGKEN